jgi:hypothetical protein
MAPWRESLFAFMHHNAQRPGAYFKIPSAQIMEIGIEFQIWNARKPPALEQGSDLGAQSRVNPDVEIRDETVMRPCGCARSGTRLNGFGSEGLPWRVSALRGLPAAGAYGIAVIPSTVLIPRGKIRAVPLVYRGAPIGRWLTIAWNPQRFLAPYAEQFVDEMVVYTRRNFPNRDLARRAPMLPKQVSRSKGLGRAKTLWRIYWGGDFGECGRRPPKDYAIPMPHRALDPTPELT